MAVTDATTTGHGRGTPRVLMVVRLFHPWIGGTERQAHRLAAALLDRGVDVQVVTGRWFRGTRRREMIDGVPVHRNHTLWHCFGIKGLRKFGGYLYMATLWWHLWRRRATYDVIHVHGLNYHTFVAVIAGRRLGKPVIAKLANSGPASDVAKMQEDRQLALARFMLPTALGCDRFVALNPAVIDELQAVGVPAGRIVELPNGVDTRWPARADYGLHDPATVTYIGRLHRQKGLDVLLRAFAQLRPRLRHRVVLRLVGEGPMRPHLQALAEQLGVTQDVDFVGRRDDVTADLDGADVFVLPSYAEGLSNALLEAMAHGVPSVGSDVPGNRDVIIDGVSGLVAAAGDPWDLASALERLLRDHALRHRLGTTARQTAKRHYSFEVVADRYMDLYATLSATAGPRVGMGER